MSENENRTNCTSTTHKEDCHCAECYCTADSDCNKERNPEVDKGRTRVRWNVYTALSKRKIYKERLKTLLDNTRPADFFTAERVCERTVNGLTKDEYKQAAQSKFDTIRNLINNIAVINEAIEISNATTQVTVSGTVYTVAGLIHRMLSFDSEREFYETILRGYSNAVSLQTKMNATNLTDEKIASAITERVKILSEKVESADESDAIYKKAKDEYISDNSYEIIGYKGRVDNTDVDILGLNEFRDDVDNALNMSNIQTYVTIDLYK